MVINNHACRPTVPMTDVPFPQSLVLPAITAHPLKTPLPLLDTYSKVDIYYPNVHRGPPILQFRALPSEPDSVVGVPLGIVLDACFVVAGNQPGELHLYALP
jgi:hypothetical protein